MASKPLFISAGIVIATFLIVVLVQGGEDPQPSEERVHAASFSLTDIETGGEITLESYDGEPLVIHVFASWCGLCSSTARSIASYADEEDFNVLLISADTRESEQALLEFKERLGRDSWRIARLTPEMERAYAVRSLDTKFVIADGEIVYSDTRSWRADDARRHIGGVV